MTARYRVKATLLSASILATAMVGVNPALAADAAPADAAATDNDGTIIVTATRRDTSLADVPINISALSASTLESQRLNDVRDLGAFVPGITITDTGPRGAGTIVMRGLSADDSSTFADNANSAIGTYLGEVPLYLDFKLIDLQRIEVLLGPQGTLYGLGTLAGAIRYIPERPDASKVSGYVHGRAYNVNNGKGISYVADGAINLPIIPDVLAFRSATGYYFDTGFIDYPFAVKTIGTSLPQPGPVSNPAGTAAQQAENFGRLKDVNFERTFTTRNQLGLTVPDFKAYVSFVYQQTKTNGRQANGAGVLGEGRYEGPWRVPEPSNRQSYLVSLEMEAQLANIATIVSSTAYTQTTNRTSADVTDLLIDLDYDYDSWPQFVGFNRNYAKTTQINQELRVVSAHGGPFSWVVGGFFNQSKVSTSGREFVPGFGASPVGLELIGLDIGFAPTPNDNEYAAFGRSKRTEQAVFGEASFKITPEWQVTGGLRYYHYDVTSRGGATTPYFTGTVTTDEDIPSLSGVAQSGGVVWKANTSYKLSDDVLVYATYSTGYRLGGANTGAGACPDPLPQGQQTCALPNELFFGPDKTKNLEIGIRAALFDKRLSFNLSIFDVKWDGIQLAGQTFYGAVGITVNGGKATNRGVDFSFNANVTDRFALRGNYSYLDAKLTEGVPDLLQVRNTLVSSNRPKFSKVDVLAGDRLPGSAAHSGAISAAYTLPVGDNKTIFDWTATYVGDILTRVGGRGAGEKLPGYVMNRASITYQTPVYEISFFANNIFNKYAVTGVSNDLSRVGFAPSGTLSRFYARSVARPRVIGIEGRLKF
jgi:iron complex outermembrane recepter protein